MKNGVPGSKGFFHSPFCISHFPLFFARLSVRRPGVLVAAALLILFGAISIIQSRQAFDSEILNLLPADAPAVQGLKLYNSRFNSSRELAFLVESGDPESVDDFIDELSRQPWVTRILDGPPTESSSGRETLPQLVAPLLLAQDDQDFDRTLDLLDAEKLKLRVASLAAKAAAGSPVALMELTNDPTGLIAPVAAGLSQKLSIAETFDMTSGDVRIVPVVTNQPDLSAESCSALMKPVRQFLEGMASRPGAPHVSVTGRSPYVDEIASSMQRDIVLTSLVSIAAVTCLFWFSFRSLVPLAGPVLILAWSCVLALAAGSLVFDKLNVVAMGFCSILVGLGDDFSLLLYQRYVGARGTGMAREAAIEDSIRRAAPGILWVALTTSLGFAALSFSGSAGFAQLGILISIGVVAGAFGMIAFMPLFERDVPARHGDPVLRLCVRLLNSDRIPLFSAVVFSAVFLIAAVPWRPLHFDTSTRSLEPRDIPAAKTLARIMEIFPATFEPVMVLVPGTAGRGMLPGLDRVLEDLKSRGLISKFSSPSPLSLDPSLVERNIAKVRALDMEEVQRSLASAEESSGLRPGALDSGMRILQGLKSPEPLQARLSASSPWWFVLDRMLAPGSGDVIYYLQLPENTDSAARRVIEEAVHRAAPGAFVTGWSQMLQSLVPWATRELLFFGGIVVAVILVLLLFIYRESRAFFLHITALFLAMCGTVATLKLADRPVNLLNVLAFPLILAVGVDYGVHLLLAIREPEKISKTLPEVMKPVLISALTTITGFGALTLARNPALNGLGFVCATGVAWCLATSFLVIVPAVSLRRGMGGSAG